MTLDDATRILKRQSGSMHEWAAVGAYLISFYITRGRTGCEADPLAAWQQDTDHLHHRVCPSREARCCGRTPTRQPNVTDDHVASRSAGAGTELSAALVAKGRCMKLIGIVALVLIVLSACAQQELTQNPCVVTHGSGFVGTTGNRERITVAENGSPCAMEVAGNARRLGGQFGLGGQIETPPMHGTASVRETPYASEILYTPAPNFVGDDRFEVTFGPDFNATVFVHVVPVANK
jgi:hypothetical protein